MDVTVDEKKLALENEEKITRAWLQHPLAVRFSEELQSQSDAALSLLLDRSPTNIETLVGHFELIGFLRAIRHAQRSLRARADEIEEELENLK